jgi:hypothetical protein
MQYTRKPSRKNLSFDTKHVLELNNNMRKKFTNPIQHTHNRPFTYMSYALAQSRHPLRECHESEKSTESSWWKFKDSQEIWSLEMKSNTVFTEMGCRDH